MCRLFRWLVAIVSVSIALVLVGLGISSRDGGVSVSLARGGTYRDLRLERGQCALTLYSNWPIDQPAEWRRWPRSHPQGGALKIPVDDRLVALRDGLSVMPIPRRVGGWWPVRIDEGRAQVWSATMRDTFSPRTTPPATRLAMTADAILSFQLPRSPAPDLTLRPPFAAGKSGSGDRLLADLERDTALAFRTSPATQPLPVSAPAPASRLLKVAFAPAPTRPYTRFSIPQWLPIAVALLPTGWIATAALLRLRRRRSRERHGLCIACGYDLRGVPEHACPECGLAPADLPSTNEHGWTRIRPIH